MQSGECARTDQKKCQGRYERELGESGDRRTGGLLRQPAVCLFGADFVRLIPEQHTELHEYLKTHGLHIKNTKDEEDEI